MAEKDEIVKYTGFTEEEENVLAPFLTEQSVSSEGVQELVFEFPEPNPLNIDFKQIEKRFKNWSVDVLRNEFFGDNNRTFRPIIGTKITVSNG